MPDRKYLAHYELRKLLAHDFGPTDNLLYQIGIATGLRASEMTNIKLQNFRPDEHEMRIWDEKKDDYRFVVIDNWVNIQIVQYLEDHYTPLNGVRAEIVNYSISQRGH